MPVLSQSEAAATVEPTDALGVTERVRLLRDGLINNAGLLINGAIAVLLVPLMLKHLGAEAYGFWIAVTALSGLVGVLDFGLSWSLTREVAATVQLEEREVSRFITGAFNIQIILGLAGALVIGSLGPWLKSNLHLSAETQRVAPAVFWMAGLLFLGDKMLELLVGLLNGLRRFGIINLILIAAALLRATGIIALLLAGFGLMAIAAWQGVLSLLIALLTLIVLHRLEPRFFLRPGALNWREVRAHVPFSLSSSLATLTSLLIWDAPRVLIGIVFGSARIVPYHIGQRLPLIATEVSWRATMVLFPAASKYERARELNRTREVLEVGTRWAVVLTLPLCLLLSILASAVLQIWVGEARAETVLILRLTAAAVFLDAAGMGAYQVLLGFGAARAVLLVFTSIAAVNLALIALLLSTFGIIVAAYGLLLVFALISLATLYLASHRCQTSMLQLLGATFKGLWLPALASATTAFIIARFVWPTGVKQVVGAGMAGFIVYLVCLYFYGAREEEQALARQAWTLSAVIARTLRRRLRRQP
jgi:O-antigen/teichoic acid export membrane protein